MPVPPRLVRRLVLAPLVVALDVAVVVLSPVLLLVAALLSPLFGGLRPLRMLLIVARVRRPPPRRHPRLLRPVDRAAASAAVPAPSACSAAHYAVMRWFVAGVYRAIVRLARVEVAPSRVRRGRRRSPRRGRPVVVLSRHAGEGDTLLVIHELLCRHDRGPRVVMHEALRLDPLIDVLGERLPNRFVDPARRRHRGRDRGDGRASWTTRAALVIFPEGANFTEERRRRGIERLEQAGHAEEAGWAREMRHVSAPRPGGALAAIDAAPEADVVVMGHVGFPTGLGEVWRLLPERQTIEVRLWHEPADVDPGRATTSRSTGCSSAGAGSTTGSRSARRLDSALVYRYT